ncbi:MAG: hypothetical protein WCD53_24550 [Microcoleus sp.]
MYNFLYAGWLRDDGFNLHVINCDAPYCLAVRRCEIFDLTYRLSMRR